MLNNNLNLLRGLKLQVKIVKFKFEIKLYQVALETGYCILLIVFKCIFNKGNNQTLKNTILLELITWLYYYNKDQNRKAWDFVFEKVFRNTEPEG